MKILGIDTSSKFLSIAVSENNDIIKEENLLLDRQHSSLLVPKIKELLKGVNLSIGEVDVFVVGLGPGSFTGLRIGVSAVKGFGIALGKPCIGVASIDAMALNVDDREGQIVPVIDAKRNNVYSAIYVRKNSRITKRSKHLLLKIEDLMKKVKGPAIFLGDGVSLYKKNIERLSKGSIFLEERYWYPRAFNLIRLAFPEAKKNKKRGLSRLNPIYLYPRDCQVKKN